MSQTSCERPSQRPRTAYNTAACRENRSDGLLSACLIRLEEQPDGRTRKAGSPLFRVHRGKVVRNMTADVEQRQARDMTKARVPQLHVITHHTSKLLVQDREQRRFLTVDKLIWDIVSHKIRRK